MTTAVKMVLACLLLCGLVLHAGEQFAPPSDLGQYRTTQNAITTRVRSASPAVEGQTGYVGVSAETDPSGRLVIAEISPGSPAALAGLQKSDRLLAADRKAVGSADELRAIVQAKSPGDALPISIERDGARREGRRDRGRAGG